MTIATRNAFFYGMTESLGETAIAYSLTAARWGVLSYDWYTQTFFGAKARARYQEIGQILGVVMVMTIAAGITARILVQHWVDAEVAAALPCEEPTTGADPFCPTVNPYPVPVMAATITAPVATLVIPTAKAKQPTTAELRRQCQAAGIRWRNAHANNRHLSKAEMIAALA